MKKAITTLVLTIFAAAAFAQGASDAVGFSQTFYQGTAKALGMGNALGAVGGDMTATCINPAGMGLYRSSELAMTLNLSNNHTTSTYYGTETYGNKLRLSIPNISYVGTRQRSNYKAVRYTQFCIGLTRTNDYNTHIDAAGLNPTSSKIDDYLSQIDGYSVDDLADYFPNTAYPAWQTYLIDVDNDGYYTSPVPQGGIMQRSVQDFRGRSEAWAFGYSINLKGRLSLGASIGIPHIKRVGTRVLEESMPRNSETDTGFNSWSFTEYLSTRGRGIQAKIGFVWLANGWLRIGGAVHTPTAYNMEESWQTETESEIEWITRESLSLESNYEYRLVTPARYVGSLAFIVGDRGLVSIDAEYLNYGHAAFSANDYDYSDVNRAIAATYGPALNVRLGTEWRVRNSYLRFGAGFYGDPNRSTPASGSVKKASVGISVPAGQSTTFDFAYELSHGQRQYTLYDAVTLGIEPVMQRQWRSVAIATMRVRF